MKIKLNIRDFLWMAAGAIFLFLVMLFVWHFQSGQRPIEQLASRAGRVDLVAQMRLNLASASEAEKSAVLAVTDQDSKTFADQARAATSEVEMERNELRKLLTKSGSQNERDLLIEFSRVFYNLQRIDSDLLVLAVKNTNIKAYSLAFGPSVEALNQMDTALSRLVKKSAGFTSAGSVPQLANSALVAALRIQTLLAPHIAEESDAKMDELEVQMTKEDQEVRKNMGSLSSIQDFHNDPDLKIALTSYNQFSEVRTRIIALSRENTNVHSLTISLGQKRKILFMCQEVLSTLQQTILEEPIMGVNSGSVSNPRSLQIEKPKEK
jgi:hypothetical protein